MPCSTQEAQNLTTLALTSLCGQPLTDSNFLTPLATDLNNIKEQSFMDDGSSCSRLIAPDYFSLSGVSALIGTTNTNISTMTIPAVPYASRILLTGSVGDTIGTGAGSASSTARLNITTGNYFGAGGAVFQNKKQFIKVVAAGTAQADDAYISLIIDIAANASGSLYFSGVASVVNIHTFNLDLKAIRVHQ